MTSASTRAGEEECGALLDAATARRAAIAAAQARFGESLDTLDDTCSGFPDPEAAAIARQDVQDARAGLEALLALPQGR